MSAVIKSRRAQLWSESLGEWSWPGQGAAVAAEVLPPPWIPAFPPRREAAAAATGAASRQIARRRRYLALAMLLSAMLSASAALALQGQLDIGRLIGTTPHAVPIATEPLPASLEAPSPLLALPSLTQVSEDSAGSSIDSATYASKALHGQGTFLVYLPSGYAATSAHYPVLYMLTGTDQPDAAFLEIGLQSTLDRLIASHRISPMIAVMVQGGLGSNLWRNQGSVHYESYILEVQDMIDQMLPTVPERDARGIVGDSMGGYGAMNVALSNPYRFGVEESWLGFFNGLEGDLRADRPVFARLGLHSFIYGAESDHIANPAEDAPFAAALRAAHADAHSAIYPGEHNLETLEAHLTSMLTFAGRAFAQATAPQAKPVIAARPATKTARAKS